MARPVFCGSPEDRRAAPRARGFIEIEGAVRTHLLCDRKGTLIRRCSRPVFLARLPGLRSQRAFLSAPGRSAVARIPRPLTLQNYSRPASGTRRFPDSPVITAVFDAKQVSHCSPGGAEGKNCPTNSYRIAYGVVVNEARVLEPLHEKGNARPCRPHHFRQRFLTNLRNIGLG